MIRVIFRLFRKKVNYSRVHVIFYYNPYFFVKTKYRGVGIMLQGITLQNWNYAAALELCCNRFFEKSYAAGLELCCNS